MVPSPRTPRSTAGSSRRSRQKTSAAVTGSRRRERDATTAAATEPPPKRRRYVPGGPGGGGRFLDKDGNEVPGGRPSPANASASTSRSRPRPSISNSAVSPIYPRRERSTRTRTATRAEPDDEMQISSAAAVAAAVVQSEGYKPREERGWEEFHPNLDIDAIFMVFHADDVDGTAKSMPGTPSRLASATDLSKAMSPMKDANGAAESSTGTPGAPANGTGAPGLDPLLSTPTRRRSNRPRDSYFPYRSDFASTPKTPKVLPIYNQTPKERLDLKQPQYRKTDRILLFESKKFGQAKYVDKAMMNVGYQESDNFPRTDRQLIKATDANVEDEADQMASTRPDGEASHTHALGRVEYDMDEQDDVWLEAYNEQRKAQGWSAVTREHFEITMTKIEKEWHALEKKIPKPNPKPPQTHRPRSSSAAAVNGEPQAGEEQDSKCAICDDGDCENTNAIVFCDGCDLAVHQECYGVPFIPEGQWLCRKCQLIGRGIPVRALPPSPCRVSANRD